MVESVSTHAQRMMEYEFKHGRKTVERFLDSVLAIEEHIDPYFFIKREISIDEEKRRANQRPKDGRYDDLWYLDKAERDAHNPASSATQDDKERSPRERLPEKDLLFYIMKNSPSLAPWQRDAIAMVHEEMEYFVPQMQTKIMNEGWASYWHSTIMTQRAVRDSEVVDYADHHSGTVSTQPGRLNPYKLGLELFRDIEERWNKGRHGREWEECDEFERRKAWDSGAGKGREKIFEVRALYNDVTFIDEFLTADFCDKHRLFVYDYNESTNQYEISSRSFVKIKESLLFQLTNFGQPWVYVRDANFMNRGELVLWHRYEGVPLRLDYARDVLENLHAVWKRPVHLETCDDDRPIVLSYDGSEHRSQERDRD
jgi:stage V sporulation protein R